MRIYVLLQAQSITPEWDHPTDYIAAGAYRTPERALAVAEEMARNDELDRVTRGHWKGISGSLPGLGCIARYDIQDTELEES